MNKEEKYLENEEKWARFFTKVFKFDKFFNGRKVENSIKIIYGLGFTLIIASVLGFFISFIYAGHFKYTGVKTKATIVEKKVTKTVKTERRNGSYKKITSYSTKYKLQYQDVVTKGYCSVYTGSIWLKNEGQTITIYYKANNHGKFLLGGLSGHISVYFIDYFLILFGLAFLKIGRDGLTIKKTIKSGVGENGIPYNIVEMKTEYFNDTSGNTMYIGITLNIRYIFSKPDDAKAFLDRGLIEKTIFWIPNKIENYPFTGTLHLFKSDISNKTTVECLYSGTLAQQSQCS